MSNRATTTGRRTRPTLVVGRADDRRGEPSPGERVKVWRVRTDHGHDYLGEGRLLGWLHRARVYKQLEAGRSPPYFIIEGAMCPASRGRDLRMPVIEMIRPYPSGPPPEFPVYPRCPECGGALGLDEYEADAGLIRCYGLRQVCYTCRGDGLWGEDLDQECPACDESGYAPREGCGSLFVDLRDAGTVPALIAK